MLPPGMVFDDKFEIIRSLGQGGFGQVFLAKQKVFDRHVAIKLLSLTEVDEEVRLRFEREAKLLSVLKHQNIATFLGFGMWNGAPYTVLEYIHGQTLGERIQQGRLRVAETVEIAKQVLSALSHAHKNGVVHRDLKPANIMLDKQTNQCKLIDFGLAHIDSSTGQQLTQEGVALGSVLYMSPEQCVGQPVDARADLYALGCIVYECLNGAPPFVGDTSVAILYKHLNEPFPSSNQIVDPSLTDWLTMITAKNAEDRFQSADEALTALSDPSITLISKARPRTYSSHSLTTKNYIVASILSVGIVCGGALGFYFAVPKKQSEESPVHSLAVAVSGIPPLPLEQEIALAKKMPEGWKRHDRLMQIAGHLEGIGDADRKRALALTLEEVPWTDHNAPVLDQIKLDYILSRLSNELKQYELAAQHSSKALTATSRAQLRGVDLWLVPELYLERRVAATGLHDEATRIDCIRRSWQTMIPLIPRQPRWNAIEQDISTNFCHQLLDERKYEEFKSTCLKVAQWGEWKQTDYPGQPPSWWYRWCENKIGKRLTWEERRELFLKSLQAARAKANYIEEVCTLRQLAYLEGLRDPERGVDDIKLALNILEKQHDDGARAGTSRKQLQLDLLAISRWAKERPGKVTPATREGQRGSAAPTGSAR